MRIISQCKTRSVEFSNSALLVDYKTIYARTADQDLVLGEYGTPSRALEVFEHIHDVADYFTTNLYHMPKE